MVTVPTPMDVGPASPPSTLRFLDGMCSTTTPGVADERILFRRIGERALAPCQFRSGASKPLKSGRWGCGEAPGIPRPPPTP